MLTKGLRSERAVWIVLAEMDVRGVSTRKVAALVEDVLGLEVSSSTVSRAAQELAEILQAWRERPLSEQPCPCLYLDAHDAPVRVDGPIRDVAMLVVVGVGADGHRRVLGVDVALSEQEAHRSKQARPPGQSARGSPNVKVCLRFQGRCLWLVLQKELDTIGGKKG